jgi:uncharacterized protein (DUF736 family)
MTWTARTAPETGGPKNFPLRSRAFTAKQNSSPRQCAACALPVPVQGRPAPSLRSGVDRDAASLEVGRQRKRTGDLTMANALGYVSETKTGFSGSLAMMNLTAPIRIEKNADKKVPAQPDYRIFAGDIETEIGGGWIVRAKTSGREYISVTLADPQIGPSKIYANLAAVKGKKGRYVMLWNPKD